MDQLQRRFYMVVLRTLSILLCHAYYPNDPHYYNSIANMTDTLKLIAELTEDLKRQ